MGSDLDEEQTPCLLAVAPFFMHVPTHIEPYDLALGNLSSRKEEPGNEMCWTNSRTWLQTLRK